MDAMTQFTLPIMAGTCGPCRVIHGKPLFVYLRSVTNCRGSKIDHLLKEGSIRVAYVCADVFLAVLNRLLRDSPMDVPKFSTLVVKMLIRYGPTEQSLSRRGMDWPVNYFGSLIGDVRLIDGAVSWNHNKEIAQQRDQEFAKPKYKKMTTQQIEFAMSLFELAALTKQLSKEMK